jgi:hypothetical protein
MLGERVRPEARADGLEPPPEDPAPPVDAPDDPRTRSAALPAAPERRSPSTPPPSPATLPGLRVATTRAPATVAGPPQPRAEGRGGGAERRGAFAVEDAGSTEPSMPRFELPGRARPAADPPAAADADGEHPWSSGLASRIDAALHDEWSIETPVVPPTKAELQTLLGTPDPTRQQSLDELEALHRAADELPSEPDPLAPPPRRMPYPTTEVDPDQIEAAIELAPPARRPHTVAAAHRPKKRE